MNKNTDYRSILQNITDNGFDWNYLNIYFPFSDFWSEGQYEEILSISCKTIQSNGARIDLLAILDLQYMVLLEKLALQEYRSKEAGVKIVNPIFGERVMAYLEINSNFRPGNESARSALLGISPGELWLKLFE